MSCAQPPSQHGNAQQRQLPTHPPQSSVDYVPASLKTPYAQSTLSSNFTLSTGRSSTSSASFNDILRSETTSIVLPTQLKRLYREIPILGVKVSREESNGPRITPKGQEKLDDDTERDRWKRVLEDHKTLAEMIHNLLRLTHTRSHPLLLVAVPQKCHLTMRLWLNGFHPPPENFRRCAFNHNSSIVALEHLQDFIYYASSTTPTHSTRVSATLSVQY
ncbi:hypothetical protein BJ322DRAFT_1114814 [Thelephora terrestris]|uniref:Uncharacterized protein n=1 Tax=Thelephora terrestris TaxID=56493 RepID=A0A9P6H2Q0_9AGAM|nr:hypothetical protein BJ322DRAFT_1114814 [Thelephora terrestris]